MLLIVVLVGLTFVSAGLFYFVSKKLIYGNSTPLTIQAVIPPNQESKNQGLPIRLNIPKLKVDTALEQVGLTPQGAVEAPKNSDNAAWYELGPRPGEIGSAVITGHYGRWKNGQGSVFDNLNELKPGDKLYITDETGTTTAFVVRGSRSYDPEADALEVFISTDGKPHLNLVTCEGVWDKVLKSYPKRLVVFADKE